MGNKRKGRVRQKQPLLKASGSPIQTVNWTYEIPEMFLILALLDENTAHDAARLFRDVQIDLTGLSDCGPCRSFTGRVSELAQCFDSNPDLTIKTKAHLVELFRGANAALLRRFPVPAKEIILKAVSLPDADPVADYQQVMRVVAESFDGRAGRATRAKLAHLILLNPGLKGLHSLNSENLAPMLNANDDILPGDAVPGQVRASWVALQGMKGGAPSEWSLKFWLQGARETPCLRPPERDAVDRVEPDAELSGMIDELNRLWDAVVADEPRHDIPSVASVTLGLGGRVWRMMHHIVDLTKAGNGEMAEIALRCQYDSLLTLRWLLLKNEPALFQRFVDHPAGKDKRLLEFTRKMADHGRQKLKATKAAMERTLTQEINAAGVWEQVVSEERGAWTEASARDMAKELGREDAYMAVFARASDIVHGSWRGLTRYHLRKCLNPPHQFHWIPYTGPTHDAGLTPIVWGIANALEAIWSIAGTVCDSGSPNLQSAEKLMELFKTITSSRSASKGFRGVESPDDARVDSEGCSQ
jgi:hypothetical protein